MYVLGIMYIDIYFIIFILYAFYFSWLISLTSTLKTSEKVILALLLF